MTESSNYKYLTTQSALPNIHSNTSVHNGIDPKQPLDHNEQTRIVTLWILFFVGVIGNLFAFYWLWLNHRRKSRVNKIILGLVSADFMVCVFTTLFSVLFVMNDYKWTVGNFMCKIVMHVQSASLMASSNMLVILAFDRHQAVRSPLKEAISANKLLASAWVCAIVFSVPQLIVWRLKYYGTFPTCGTNLRESPKLRLVYIVYVAVVIFFIPLIVISVAYLRITKKIWDKARENTGKKQCKKGKLRIASTGTSLTRAKHKTLKMSAAIIFLFAVCGLPYFLIEILKSLKWISIDPNVYAILGIFSVSNSSLNPYIFLWFNSGGKYCRAIVDNISNMCCDFIERTRLPEYRASTSSSHDNTLRSEIEWKTSGKTDYRTYEYNYSIQLQTIKEEDGVEVPVKKVVKKYDYP